MPDPESTGSAEQDGPAASQRDGPQKIVGWREWVSLPYLGIARIKAKIDTGAQTSSLHAVSLQTFERHGKKFVRFTALPVQRETDVTIECEAEIIDSRAVRSSTGHTQNRPVIVVTVSLGGENWPIEVTLTDRTTMGFRLLLGREALRGRFLINPDGSFLAGS